MVFNTASAMQTIYTAKNVAKFRGYAAILPARNTFNVLNALDKSIHRFKRKVINQGLSDQRMREFEPSLNHHVDNFIQKLADNLRSGRPGEWSDPVNMTDMCKNLGLDIMGQYGFGQSLQLLDKPDNRIIVPAFAQSSLLVGTFGQFPDLAKWKVHFPLVVAILGTRKKYLKLINGLIEERSKLGKDARPDMFSFVSGAVDPETGRSFTKEELWSETRLLLGAGSDTTSSTLSGCFFYLSRYPECAKRAAEEVRRVFESADEIHSGTGSKMTECVYLRACIDETLRMSPPAGGTLWREIMPGTGGLMIDGVFYPEGTTVGGSIYCVHHNEEYFPDPYLYNPDRWIVSDTNTKEQVEHAKYGFFPFSVGTRSCPGKTMAYMELSNTLAKTLWYFDVTVASGPLGAVGGGWPNATIGRRREKEFQLWDHLLSTHDGPYMQFKLRDGVGKALGLGS